MMLCKNHMYQTHQSKKFMIAKIMLRSDANTCAKCTAGSCCPSTQHKSSELYWKNNEARRTYKIFCIWIDESVTLLCVNSFTYSHSKFLIILGSKCVQSWGFQSHRSHTAHPSMLISTHSWYIHLLFSLLTNAYNEWRMGDITSGVTDGGLGCDPPSWQAKCKNRTPI